MNGRRRTTRRPISRRTFNGRGTSLRNARRIIRRGVSARFRRLVQRRPFVRRQHS